MLTPAGELRRHSIPVSFNAVQIGETFECNGNVWTKRSSRTAVGIWPAILPSYSYFRTGEVCEVIRHGETRNPKA